MGPFSTLENPDFADLAQVSNKCRKQSHVSATNYAQQISLKISTELMILNIINPSEREGSLNNLGDCMPRQHSWECWRSNPGSDISSHLNKARNAFRMLSNIWRSQTVQYRDQTKVVPELCHLHSSVRLRT